MVRPPKSFVPKTTGQGITRMSYQKGYGLAHQGPRTPLGGVVPRVTTGTLTNSPPSGGRSYAKTPPSGSGIIGPQDYSYGETLDPSDVSDINAQDPLRKPRGPMKPSASVSGTGFGGAKPLKIPK